MKIMYYTMHYLYGQLCVCVYVCVCVCVCVCRALMDNLITPLELKIEEWKKVASQLDKDHAKGIGLIPCVI